MPAVARKETSAGWSVILMAWSPAELAWKQQALRTVLAATGGKECPVEEQHGNVLAANSITSLYVARFLRMGGAAAVTNGVMDSGALIPKWGRSS